MCPTQVTRSADHVSGLTRVNPTADDPVERCSYFVLLWSLRVHNKQTHGSRWSVSLGLLPQQWQNTSSKISSKWYGLMNINIRQLLRWLMVSSPALGGQFWQIAGTVLQIKRSSLVSRRTRSMKTHDLCGSAQGFINFGLTSIFQTACVINRSRVWKMFMRRRCFQAVLGERIKAACYSDFGAWTHHPSCTTLISTFNFSKLFVAFLKIIDIWNPKMQEKLRWPWCHGGRELAWIMLLANLSSVSLHCEWQIVVVMTTMAAKLSLQTGDMTTEATHFELNTKVAPLSIHQIQTQATCSRITSLSQQTLKHLFIIDKTIAKIIIKKQQTAAALDSPRANTRPALHPWFPVSSGSQICPSLIQQHPGSKAWDRPNILSPAVVFYENAA